MAALTSDSPRRYTYIQSESSQPAQASVTAYVGGALSRDSGGEVGPLLSSETFAGFCKKQLVSSSTAGNENIAVIDEGEVELTITGLNDNDDIGDTVYADNDNSFTLTNSSNAAIGKVTQIVNLTDNKARVYFQSVTKRSI